MSAEIRVASTPQDYAVFAGLIRDYWGWLGARYIEVPGLVDSIGSHQALDVELATLDTVYGPPNGNTLLAFQDGQAAGCVAYHDFLDGSAEMKRLYVADRFQGLGIGRRLVEAVLDRAATDGFELMRLDTGFLQTEAMGMYESIGFEYAEAYNSYPQEIGQHIRVMELSLVGR